MFTLLQRADRASVPECHVLHYYQMATEKIAKALLARVGRPVGRTHVAFRHIVGVLQGNPGILRAIGYADPGKTARFLARAQPLLQQIERLSPNIAGEAARQQGLDPDQGANVEYPWWQQNPAGEQEWLAPAVQTFSAFQTISARSGDGLAMLNLVRFLLDHYERIP